VEAPRLDTQQKALQLNLDPSKYGAFAETGGGQEVAHWFFRVGRAAGTIAKTISAYDMAVSDAIYGHSQRYVSRERLVAMLDHEYALLLDRLAERRGADTCFFAFADTVATRAPGRDEGDGWVGLRFQHQPRAAPSEILIHVGMRDRTPVQEQEALGILGVNLIHAAFYRREEPSALIASLVDGLSRERVEIDLIRFHGPAFSSVDNRLMSLQLVEQNLTDAAMFTAEGEVVQPSEILHKRPVLVERGRFRPVTHLTLDILDQAQAQFADDPDLSGGPPVVLMEMTLRDIEGRGSEGHEDFLARVDTLRALGKTVLVSRHRRFFALVEYLSRYTQNKIGIALGVPSLVPIGDARYYDDLPGGALEAAGRLFRRNVRLYVYPTRNAAGEVVTAETLKVPPAARHLHAMLLDSGFFVPIRKFNAVYLDIDPDDALARIQSGRPGWEASVPAAVVEVIKREGLFGWNARRENPVSLSGR
jgi:hypothetical protein